MLMENHESKTTLYMKTLNILVRVHVELVELFGDVRAHVALLDGLGRLQRLLRRDADLALSQ